MKNGPHRHAEGRQRLHALLLDPLTAAVCSPAEIQEMFERMFKAERKFLKSS